MYWNMGANPGVGVVGIMTLPHNFESGDTITNVHGGGGGGGHNMKCSPMTCGIAEYWY